MKKRLLPLLLLGAVLLSGCSFLNRFYSSVSPHSATYYESEDRSVLKAESYQDLVNDLLVVVAAHEENGTILYYGALQGPDAAAAMEAASREVQLQTPLGAYAVDYMTYTTNADQSTYSRIQVELHYRRTAEQVGAMIHTTSVSALYDLLTAAAEGGQRELVLQVGYFRQQTQEVEDTVQQVRQDLSVDEETVWQVNYYPDSEHPGIIEILLGE